MARQRIAIIITVVILGLIFFVLAEWLIIKFNGLHVPAPAIPREPQTIGQGSPLTYVIMGDSTSIGQGTEYRHSYAVASAAHLAQDHQVTWANVGISGAVTKDVADTQLRQATAYKPDIVLLAVGANDAKNFVGRHEIQTALQKIIDGLRQANCNVRIIVTGSPAMDTVPRFPWPVTQLMGLRTRQVNAAFAPLIAKNHLTFVPIAAQTGPAFRADPSLFAADKFHPDAGGYALWTPVINRALDQALRQPLPQSCE